MSENEVAKEDEIDLLLLISVLIKNKITILVITLISMGLIVIYSVISLKLPSEKSFLPNEYSPKTLVMLNSNSGSGGGLSSILGEDSGLGALAGLAGVSGASEVTDAELAKKLVKKASFYKKLDNEFNLSEVYKVMEENYPITALRKAVNDALLLETDELSGILEISYTHIDKYLATKIVNRVTELLEEEFADIDRVKNKNQYSIAEEQKKIVEKEISRIQSEIITFQNKHRMIDASTTTNEIARLLSNLQTQLLQKEVAIESYGRISNVRDPGYTGLMNEKKAIETSIRKLENGEVGDYPSLEELPVLSMELSKLKSALDIQLMGYKAIEQQYQTLKLTAGGTGPTFQVIERAEIPEMKSGPSRGKLCIIVTFAGFFVSIFFVFIKESWLKIKNDPEKMKRLRGEN